MSSIQDRIEKILELSKADGCIVVASQSSAANVRWANNTSTTNGLSRSEGVSVISIIGKRVGKVARSYFPDESLEELVRESEASCVSKPDAPDFMPLVAGDGSLPAGWDDGLVHVDPREFSQPTSDLISTFGRAAALDILLFGYASQTAQTIYVATSRGIRRRHSHSQANLMMVSKTPDFVVSASHQTDHSSIAQADVEAVYRRLVERMAWSEKPIQLPAGRYPVLLEPAAVGELMYHVLTQMSARDADEGSTAFSRPGGGNMLGEKLFPEFINLYSDPTEPGLERPDFVLSTSSGAFGSVFDCGIDAGRSLWIKQGVLSGLITPRYWAEKTGSTPTFFPGNLILEADESKDLATMIGSTQRALLVTRLWYTRMLDPQTLLLTGLTRDGVYLVEDGQVQGSVNNFRYNMSPLATLRQTTELGASAQAFNITRVPHLRVDDFNMSSVSDAS